MLSWLNLIKTSIIILALKTEIPSEVPRIEGTNYLVVFSSDNCGPCNAMYEQVFKGESREEINKMFTSVLILDNDKERRINGVLQAKKPVVPMVVVYRYINGKMVELANRTGYDNNKESLLNFLRKWKNEKSKVEYVEELPSIFEGIFKPRD